MKYIKKSILTFVLILTFSFQSICYSETQSTDDYNLEESDDAGLIFSGVMQFIKENYIGGEIDSDELLNAALKGMTSVLDDYSDYYTFDEYKEFEKTFITDFYTLGIIVTQADGDYPVVTEVFEDTPAEKSGVEVGDKIITINSTNLKNVAIQTAFNQILNSTSKKIELEISRSDKLIVINTQLEETKVNTVYLNDISELTGNDNHIQNEKIGYIKVNLISVGTANDFEKAVTTLKNKGKNKLILDLRGNVGGVVEEAFSMCDLIVPEGKIVSMKDKEGNVNNISSELKKPYFEKIVVLTDSTTASAAEMIASALQDSGAGVLVGTKTYGKGIIQTITPVLDLGVIKMTTLEYFTRNGNKINKVGITPDILVNVPLFLTETDDVESEKVINALSYLGYNTDTRIKIMNAIGKIQKDKKLNITRTITKETANEINLQIYEEMNNNDKILMAGYEEILKN